MSLLGKIMDSMRLSEDDEDDYFLDDDYEEDEKPSRKGFSAEETKKMTITMTRSRKSRRSQDSWEDVLLLIR